VKIGEEVKMKVRRNHFAGAWSFLHWSGIKPSEMDAMLFRAIVTLGAVDARKNNKKKDQLVAAIESEAHPDVVFDVLRYMGRHITSLLSRIQKNVTEYIMHAIDDDKHVLDFFNESGM
jgi:hypothetical protein